MNKTIFFHNSVLLLIMFTQLPTSAQNSHGVLSNGGATMNNSTQRVRGTLGQPLIGTASNATQTSKAGFWYLNQTPATALPPWTFVANTASSATIAVPAAINPVIRTQPLQTGDAIGVFFQNGNALLCAGYGIWQSGQNLALTAWGDNSQTTVKDGFAEGDLIRYKIWGAAAQKEYDAEATYRTGGTTFTNNGIYELSSLRAVTSVSHSNALAQGWNMISSFVEPNPANLETVMAEVISKMVIMKNGRGQVFWPSLGINQIGSWNPRDGYQIFMQSGTPFTITGNQIVPEATPIALSQGWNLVSYLRNSEMNIDAALASLGNKLVIAKNNAGQVYWPALGINQIGAMMLGQGYLLYLSEAATLTYPGNGAAASSGEDAPLTRINPGTEAMKMELPQHYSATTVNTGINATVLIESSAFADGDEIAVQNENGKVVGSGVFKRGKALLTIWGDNEVTKNVTEGAVADEILSLKVWSPDEQKEKAVVVTSLENGLTNVALNGELRYQTNAVWKAQVSEAIATPSVFSLAQNYPNPFNPSTAIKYGLPHDAKVTLEVFDALGRRVAVLVNAPQPAGYHEAVFQNPALPSGLYFYRLQAGTFVQTNKMVILR